MNKRDRTGTMKVCLIVLLAVSAAAMLFRLAVYSDIGIPQLMGTDKDISSASDGVTRGYAQCAKPLAAAVTNSEGGRYGVRYDETAVEELYTRYSAALAEALGSAGTPKQVGFDEWESALSGPGVFFDFVYAQPLGSLSAWLGSEVDGGISEHTAARLCLSVSKDAVWLYYIRAKDANAYRCSTLATLSTDAAGFETNGAKFAFETGGNDGIDPYTLSAGGTIELQTVDAANPLRVETDGNALMEHFGMNSFIALTYAEPDGTKVYVDGDAALRLSPDGTVSFRQNETGLLPANTDRLETVIDAAYRLADRVSTGYRGDCGLMLSSVTYSESDAVFSVTFQYTCNGLIVRLPDSRPAAEVTVSGGYITTCEIYLREYTAGEERVFPLPEKQAFALIAAEGGGEPLLCLIDEGGETVPDWVIFER